MNIYILVTYLLKRGLSKTLVVVAAAWCALNSVAMAEQLTEEVYMVNAVDVSANRIELANPRLTSGAFDMNLAFDVEIRLLNGEKGSLNNLRNGDVITAVIDVDKKQVVKIALAARADN